VEGTLEQRVLANPADVTRAGADLIADAVARRPDLVIAWPTGRTPVPLYEELDARVARGELDLSRARGFNLDELVARNDDPRNFRTFMGQYAWWRAGRDAGRFEIPDGAADPETERARYEAAIATAGGIDLCLLGIGTDGNVAYNMPGPAVFPVHVTNLPDAVAEELKEPRDKRPLRAITMGLGTLRAARRVVLFATGASKVEALRRLASGPEDPRWPCTYLTSHPDLVVLCDRAASPDRS
jgi:glucosamine-6-phosphate deaminase